MPSLACAMKGRHVSLAVTRGRRRQAHGCCAGATAGTTEPTSWGWMCSSDHYAAGKTLLRLKTQSRGQTTTRSSQNEAPVLTSLSRCKSKVVKTLTRGTPQSLLTKPGVGQKHSFLSLWASGEMFLTPGPKTYSNEPICELKSNLPAASKQCFFDPTFLAFYTRM